MAHLSMSSCLPMVLASAMAFGPPGCKSKESAPAAGSSAAVPASAGPGAPTAPSAAAAVAPSGPQACPAGRWKYDYSDQALEVLMKGAAGAKVIEEDGEFFCDVSAGKEGTITCATQGKPVVNVVETQQAGIPMVISVTIDGKATTRFKLMEGNRMTVVSSDTTGLKILTKVTLAGREVPFPTDKLLTLFGNPESTIDYKCEAGKLSIKPQIEGVDNTWQELTPAG